MFKNRLSTKLQPVFWSIAIFIVAQALTFATVWRQGLFFEEQNINLPSQPPDVISVWPGPITQPDGTVVDVPVYSSIGPILIYFAVVIAVMALVLYYMPMSLLKRLLRFLFGLLFAWGIFVALAVWLPFWASIAVAAVIGFAWLLYPKVWLHNSVMVLAMVSLAAVFGRFISPWTAMVLLAILAIYDLFAVRFGFMLWLASKLSLSKAMPAFVFPRSGDSWNGSMEAASFTTAPDHPSVRRFSILGGGDIAFPLLVSASVFFAAGFRTALIIAGFGLLGLTGAYAIQIALLKGKPVPALPPIAVSCAIGLLLFV